MHLVNSKVGLYNVKTIHEPGKFGDGKLVYTKKVGWLKVCNVNPEGENTEFILENVQYISGFWKNYLALLQLCPRMYDNKQGQNDCCHKECP